MVALCLLRPTGVAEEMAKTQQEKQRLALERFLAGVERRALVMTEMACAHRDDAQDLLQDAMSAFVRAYGHKPEAEWAPLFHRTLQNRIRDNYRRLSVQKRRLFVFDREEGEEDPLEHLPARASDGPENQLLLADASERMLKAMAALPLRQRQAVMLRIWEGLDVAQTADAMDCSTGSVKTHLSRALQALRAKLQEYW